MSKNSLFPYNFWSLKTFALKPKDKGKSHSNKTYLYWSKPGHSDYSCYYKYSKKASDMFQEKQRDKITKLKCTIGNKNSKERLQTFGLCNTWEFIATNVVTHTTNSSKDDKWYFNNDASFHMTYDLIDFKDQELMQSHKNDIIWSGFGPKKRPQGISKVWYNFVVDSITDLFYLDDVYYCPHLNTKLISLVLLN